MRSIPQAAGIRAVSAIAALRWIATESLPAVALRRLLAYTPTIDGRASRTELVATVGIVLVVSVVCLAVLPPIPDGSVWAPFIFYQALLIVLPIGSAVVRRLHDTNRHGFAVLIVVFPYIGVFWLIGLLLWDGDRYENQFGPPPG